MRKFPHRKGCKDIAPILTSLPHQKVLPRAVQWMEVLELILWLQDIKGYKRKLQRSRHTYLLILQHVYPEAYRTHRTANTGWDCKEWLSEDKELCPACFPSLTCPINTQRGTSTNRPLLSEGYYMETLLWNKMMTVHKVCTFSSTRNRHNGT